MKDLIESHESSHAQPSLNFKVSLILSFLKLLFLHVKLIHFLLKEGYVFSKGTYPCFSHIFFLHVKQIHFLRESYMSLLRWHIIYALAVFYFFHVPLYWRFGAYSVGKVHAWSSSGSSSWFLTSKKVRSLLDKNGHIRLRADTFWPWSSSDCTCTWTSDRSQKKVKAVYLDVQGSGFGRNSWGYCGSTKDS